MPEVTYFALQFSIRDAPSRSITGQQALISLQNVKRSTSFCIMLSYAALGK